MFAVRLVAPVTLASRRAAGLSVAREVSTAAVVRLCVCVPQSFCKVGEQVWI